MIRDHATDRREIRWRGLFSYRVPHRQINLVARLANTAIGRPGRDPQLRCRLVLARRFNSLQSLDGAFERVTRYETALWRQARQVLLALASLRRGASPRHRAPHAAWQKFGVFNPDD